MLATGRAGDDNEDNTEVESNALRPMAVKILRPGIERAIERDLELFRWIAGIVERAQPRLRRLRPVAAVETFADSLNWEMDLRMEGAAASELHANFWGTFQEEQHYFQNKHNYLDTLSHFSFFSFCSGVARTCRKIRHDRFFFVQAFFS